MTDEPRIWSPGDGYPLPPASGGYHTIRFDRGGVTDEFSDMRAVGGSTTSVTWVGLGTFRCRRRLAPLMLRPRSRRWLVRRGWLRFTAPTTLTIAMPRVTFRP